MLSSKEKEIFAILFAAGDAIECDKLAVSLDMDTKNLDKIITHISDCLESEDFPIRLLRLGKKYQLATATKYAPAIKKTLDSKKNSPLSQAAMEVLAIIAYNQPVTKSFVEQIRGVDSSSIVNSLVEKGLIEEMGRLEIPGKPISYGTNENFLRCFGISSLGDLPIIEAKPIKE